MRLGCWRMPVDPVPLAGGITNTNFLVEHGGERFVVRVGDDIPVHGVSRANELAAARAAFTGALQLAAAVAAATVLIAGVVTARILRNGGGLQPEPAITATTGDVDSTGGRPSSQ